MIKIEAIRKILRGYRMFDTSTVRLFILLAYGALSIFIIFLLWRTSASGDALKNFGIAFAALLPAIITIVPNLKGDLIQTEAQLMLLFNSSGEPLEKGDGINSYFKNYHLFFLCNPKFPSGANLGDDSFDNIALDIIEKGIVTRS